MAIYHEDIVDIELNSGSIARSFLSHTIGEGDNMANRFGVALYRNGEPVSVEAREVAGVFVAPDGNRYALTETSYPGSTGKSENRAWVQLPSVCYNVEGQFSLIIKISGSGVNGTMRIVDGMVCYTGESGAVVPTSTIPTTAELIEAYEDAIAVIDSSVRFDAEQDLTDAEKLQAQENIGAYYQPQIDDIHDLIGTVPSGKTVEGQIDTISAEVANIGAMERVQFSDNKSYYYTKYRNIPSGTDIYFRSISTTDSDITQLVLMGMNMNEEQKTLAKSVFNDTEIQKVTTDEIFDYLIVYINPYPSGSWTGDIKFEILVSDTEAGEAFQIQNLQATVKENADNIMKTIGFLDIYSFTNQRFYTLPDGEYTIGTTLYFHSISVTDQDVLQLVIFGHKPDSSLTNLCKSVIGNSDIVKCVLADDYDKLLVYLNPYPSSSSWQGTAMFEFGVWNEKSKLAFHIEEVQKKTLRPANLLNTKTANIFKKVICAGDSYTKGYIDTGTETNHNYPQYSWPHFMSKMTGNEWINCGISGANTITWQTHPDGLPAAQAAGNVQAYVIGLMINDASNSDRAVPVGVIGDIGTDNQTYYAQMSKIIRSLNAISPLAKIFVNTCPQTYSNFIPYNKAVRDIVEAYSGTYPVYCIDLIENIDLYSNASLVNDAIGGHYTAIGYEQFAEIYQYILSQYMDDHISDFQNIHMIPYEN